jgi:hypothetical protein
MSSFYLGGAPRNFVGASAAMWMSGDAALF